MSTSNACSAGLLHLEDWFRTHNGAGLLSLRRLPAAYLAPSARARVAAAATLATYFPEGRLGRLLLSQARRAARTASAASEERARLGRSVIVKPYVSDREPGLLLVHFENELQKLVALKALADIERRYRLMFMATWQPFYSEPICLLAARASQPFFVLPSAFSEAALCESFSENCFYLPFHSASWVRGDLYPEPAVRSIDVLMLANFARHKRHWKLFEALRSLPDSTRVVLAGVALGDRTRESLLREAEVFGVAERLTIVERASDEELRNLMSRARLLCALTHKEGAFVAVAEALMAGLPVAMFRNAIVGTKAYINDDTGFLLDDRGPLGPQLDAALRRADHLRPQPWARATFSAEANAPKLNQHLRAWALSRGQDWTRDTEPFYCQHFDFHYFRPEAEVELTAEYAHLKQLGLELIRPQRAR